MKNYILTLLLALSLCTTSNAQRNLGRATAPAAAFIYGEALTTPQKTALLDLLGGAPFNPSSIGDTTPGPVTGTTLTGTTGSFSGAVTIGNNVFPTAKFWALHAGSVVTPAQYGAAGDGVTDDTLALRAAITAAGVKGTIYMEPGKTYLISGGLTLLAGQQLCGNNAILKRKAQVSTTTATPANSSTTAYVFASTAGFSVGNSIAFSDNTVSQVNLVAYTTLSTNNPIITSIVGTTVTVSPAPNFSGTIAGTSKIYSSFVSVMTATDCKVSNLIINGNKANFAWGRWESTVEIAGNSSHRVMVSDCYCYDCPGEGILPSGDYWQVRNCVLEQLNGNGIHFSGCANPVVDGNRIISPTLDANVGHSDGGIIWSNTITDATIINNYCYGGRTGIGSIGGGGNTDITIANNTIRSAVTYGIEISGVADRTIVSGNRIYSCGSGNSGGMKIEGTTSVGLVIRGNLLSANSVFITNSTDVIFDGNSFTAGSNLEIQTVTNSLISNNALVAGTIKWSNNSKLKITGNLIDYTGNTAIGAMDENGPGNTDVSITDNQILGGGTAIILQSVGLNYLVAGNICVGQRSEGITIVSGTWTGMVVARNLIKPTTASASSWIGLRIIGSGVVANNNNITNNVGSGFANHGIYCEIKADLIGNVVTGAYNIAPIGITAGSTNSTAAYNLTGAAIVNAGTTTQLVGNVVGL